VEGIRLLSDQPITIRRRVLLWIASIGPIGHLPASGTVAVALVGVPIYYLTCRWPVLLYVVAVVVYSLLAVWVHDVGDRLLGEKDSRKLVLDELAGFFIAVAGLGVFTWPLAILAVLVERGFDILKVPPANWVERRWPGGWGVVGDDVVAGLYTCAIMHGVIRWAPGWVGLSGV